MNAASKTFDPPTLPDTDSAIFSPASVCGVTPCAALGGLTIEQFGRALAPANLSARQAKALGLMMSGTSGPRGSNSLRSAALAESMASKLRARTALLGSTLFSLTWKLRTTPSGRSISALRASVRRTSGNGCGSWPTPMAGTPAQNGNNEAGNNDSSRRTVALVTGAPWSTPSARDWHSASGSPEFLAGWPTTTTQDSAGSRAYGYGGNTFMTLTDAARCADSGPTLNGSPVETTNSGQLNPAHSRWLMGLPPEWDACGVTAMPSLPRARKRSSKRPSDL